MASIFLSVVASAFRSMGLGGEDVALDSITSADESELSNNNNPSFIPGNIYSKEESIKRRKKFICPANRLFFGENPLKIVRGEGQYLIDENGVYILDCINNVACVGHSHPSVSYAAHEQMSMLSTNNRYLHDHILHLADRLVTSFTKLNPQLTSCLFVNSGSEANDLALRMARAHTGSYDVMVLQHAYHGHVISMMEISPYKFNLPGGGGKKDHVHIVECPDFFRGKYRDIDFSEDDLSNKYLEEVKMVVAQAKKSGRSIAAFFVESVQSCGGQIFYPRYWMRNAFEFCKKEGIVTIADEVQTGFGRCGSHFWSFQSQDVQPDIVIMGKPMGNGHPVSCVITTDEISQSFADLGVEYFNTFGGNPVSCAIALSVMDVIIKQKLQENAATTGKYLLEKLKKLQKKFPSVIGDVRGYGLMVGIDIVSDIMTRAPGTQEAKKIKAAMLAQNILLSTDGPFENVLKMKPPLVFNISNADSVVENLDIVLQSHFGHK